MTINFDKLAEPFHANEIEWRIGQAGKKQDGTIWAKAFAYVTNRAIQQRLDDVCGPANWYPTFTAPPNAAPGTASLCTIHINTDLQGQWIGKSDGADNSDMEAVKGGLSDSMKRAAVMWRIGRYLYQLEEAWVETSDKRGEGWRYQPANEKKGIPAFYWQEPRLPAWALPAGEKQETQKESPKAGDTTKQIAKKTGMKTGDEIAASNVYDSAKDTLGKYTKVSELVTFADWLREQKIAKALTQVQYDELNQSIARKAVEFPNNAKGFEAADKLLRLMVADRRIDDPTGTDLRVKLETSKESKLGAAA